ncbi:ninjurin-2-like [Mytilus trossulus]|uniref:ninjurin-2-like n=1 Tax=Mytilus trossulus TaxID=6551 RepID=UPI0030072163
MPVGHADSVDGTTTTKVKDKKTKRSDKKYYDVKKTVAECLLDLAILIVNIFMLKAVVDTGPKNEYFETLVVLISVSVFCQICVGLLLLFIGIGESRDSGNKVWLHRFNTVNVAFILLIAILNIVIGTIGIELNSGNDSKYNRTSGN